MNSLKQQRQPYERTVIWRHEFDGRQNWTSRMTVLMWKLFVTVGFDLVGLLY